MDIKIESGVKEYNLGGKVTVRFNPTDMAFADRLRETMERCIAREEEFQSAIKDNDDVAALFRASNAADADVASYINELFGMDVVTPLCEDVSIRAWAGGMPIWGNIIMGVLEVLDASQEEALKESKKRIAKYTAKYGK